MFPFVDEHEDRINAAIVGLEIGTHFRFHELFGNDWEGFGDGKARQRFGAQFAKSVKLERFPNVLRDGIFPDREVKYRRVR